MIFPRQRGRNRGVLPGPALADADRNARPGRGAQCKT